MNSQNGEKYYAATIILPRENKEKNITRQQLFCRKISEKRGIKMILQQN
jgi:hypothetical protein